MKKARKKSALQEVKGVDDTPRLNRQLIDKIKNKSTLPDVDELFDKLLSGDQIALSKAITLIESTNPKHFDLGQKIINKSLAYTENSVRIGITGVPGVGKSTFIESLGKIYIKQGHKVAVLAIDPSSSLSKGSILGDKTRMETLVRDKNAFIRPSPSGNNQGGVARKTRESIMLCEAAGFDRIIIETVGVGQSETIVHSMVDFFLLLKLAGAGDELQGIKRGIIEMADMIVINKAEPDKMNQARLAQKTFQTALHFYPPKPSGWTPKVLLASALTNKGIDKIANEIDAYIKLTRKNGFLKQNRLEQNKYWLFETVNQTLKDNFYNNTEIHKKLTSLLLKLKKREISAFEAAKKLLNLQYQNNTNRI